MNRRNFLKSLGVACSAAIIAPVASLKAEPKSVDKWPMYHAQVHIRGARSGILIAGDYLSEEKFLKKFREAFKNTKFQPPIYYHGIYEYTIKKGYHHETKTIQETK